MPKIIIREYDKTTTPQNEYSNFAVLVPGFVGENANATFDENGIYELTPADLKGFETKIGYIDINTESKSGQIYRRSSGKPCVPETPLEVGNTISIADIQKNKYYIKDGTAEKIGHLVDNELNKYKLKEIRVEEGETEYVVTEADVAAGLVQIKQENEGSDVGDIEFEAYSIGNQIAYELLTQGYTVLYKKINEITTESSLISHDILTDDWWEPLYDKSLYDFRYVIAGLIKCTANDINEKLISLAHYLNPTKTKIADIEESSGRGDIIALCDIPDGKFSTGSYNERLTSLIGAIPGGNIDKYTALFAPCVIYKAVSNSSKYENREFPASFHYLACAGRANQNFAEWYAVSGFQRGISNYTIESVGMNFGDAAVNALQPRKKKDGSTERAVNLIAKISGEYYMWGNRTAEILESGENADLKASHFLNIRQLCTTIKKQIYISCRAFMFDPNSDVLWVNFKNSIIPTLERMKADQGIKDYRITKVLDDTKALLKSKIRIVPIEAVEDFDISLYLEDSISGNIGIEEEEAE